MFMHSRIDDDWFLNIHPLETRRSNKMEINRKIYCVNIKNTWFDAVIGRNNLPTQLKLKFNDEIILNYVIKKH